MSYYVVGYEGHIDFIPIKTFANQRQALMFKEILEELTSLKKSVVPTEYTDLIDPSDLHRLVRLIARKGDYVY